MGKYYPGRRPFEGLIFVNPERLARLIFERFQTVIRQHIDEMANNYRTGIETTAGNEEKLAVMQQKLANHYRAMRPVAEKIKSEVIGPAKEQYSVEKARALAELYGGVR